ncbi:MAG TPA: serine--tRNA ligase, partial [Acidimicrobiales bacterium]|nr:serine--tRNA ligase [Acidimicrobiales bacterium]
MLDIRRIRSDLEAVKAGIARRGQDTAALDDIAELDRRQRSLADSRDRIRNEITTLSKQVGGLRREGKPDEAAALQERSRMLGDDERKLADEADELGGAIRDALLRVANLPAPDCPDGASEADNVVLRVHGYEPSSYADHQRVAHWDIGKQLGILDLERGSKLSGSMFVMYRSAGATLVRALVQYALDRNSDA